MHDHGAMLASFQGLALPATLFLAGLVGSLVHCSLMCGPFVLGQVGARMARAGAIGEGRRFAEATLVPYHLGRLTTYSILGAVAGALGATMATVSGARWVPALFLLVAAAFFAAQAIDGLRRFLPHAPAGLGMVLARIGARLGDGRGWRGYGLGLVLGFLPCGLLYGGLAAAAGAGGPMAGGIAMFAFTLGTMPGLIGVGYLGALFARRWEGALARVAPFLLLFNAAVLVVFALA